MGVEEGDVCRGCDERAADGDETGAARWAYGCKTPLRLLLAAW